MRIKRIIAGLMAMLMVITSITVSPGTEVQAGVSAGNLKKNKDYMIVAKSSGMAITVGGGLKSNKAPVFQDAAEGWISQIWILEDAGDGYYYIKNKNSGKNLVPKDNAGDEGRMMHQYKKENKDAQKWKITDAGNGYCRISPKHKPNYALNVFDNSKERGANIIQWTYGNGSDNAKWEFREVSNVKEVPVPETADAKAAYDAYIDAFVQDKNEYKILTNVSGFWAKAEAVESVIDGYERFGDEKYKEVVTGLVDGYIANSKNGNYEEGTDWKNNEYNDDIMWASIMCARTYLITKDKKYLDAAKKNFDIVYERAFDNKYGGGIYWKQNHNEKSKNACVNGPASIAACYIAQGTGDEGYYEKAKALIEWEKKTLVQDNGRVYDNIGTYDGKEATRSWAFTYNQGTFIGGCTLLYEHYNDQKYLDWAKKTAEWCTTTEDLDYCFESSDADLIGFKGILARWMGRLALKHNVTNYNDWMQQWADIAWDCRNNDNLMYTTLATPTTQDIKNCKTNVGSGANNGDKRTIGAYCAFGCSSTMSWLVNMSDMEERQKGNDPAIKKDDPKDETPVATTDDELTVGPQEGNGDVVDIGNSSSKWDLKSPNGKTSISIKLDNGKLKYSVKQDSTTMVEESDMGINTSKGDFTQGLSFKSAKAVKVNENYKNYSGIKEISTNHCHEATLIFNRNNTEFQVIARAYDDGVAFRYKVNSTGTIKIEPNKENTSFKLPNKSTVWYMNYAPKVGDFMYESEYEKKSINDIGKDIIPSMPMTYEVGSKYGLIMEADKRGTYVGSFLQPEGNCVLRTIFDKKQTKAVETSAPFQTPWRYVVIGDLNALVTNTMAENLSPAPDGQYDFDEWVQPGVSSWSWVGNWGNGISDQSKKETHMNWIDLASKMGWRYYIMDERWQPSYGKDGQKYKGYRDWFEEVRDYAEEKGVDLIAWVHKDDMDTAAEREERFKEWSKDGIKGIKIDFFYTETQDKLQLHDEIYKTAAKYHMLVNVHGSNPPSGERRTYPNVIAREAIRGQEQGGIKCEQYTLIPFIRGAVGTADVTEELYSKDTNKTTMGFQIALSVLVENGIRSLGSKPEQYLNLPAAVSYYRNFPEKWDETVLLDSKIGDYVNMARRSGDGWYAAGISVNEKTVSLKPTFLKDGVEYTAILYTETNDSKRSNIKIKSETKKNITKDSKLSINMKNGGGYAVKFFPQNGASETEVRAFPSVAKIGVDKTKNLKVQLTPATSGMADFDWSVKDSKIASIEVTASGVTVKGVKEGKTQIIATSVFDTTKKVTFEIEVTNDAKNGVHTVEFDAANGSEIDAQFVSNGNKAKEPDEPKKGNFKFLGWYAGNERYNFSNKVTKDLLLTAKWDGEYKNLALEAEAATLSGSAKVLVSADASKGYLIEGIGGEGKGTLTFTIPAEIPEERTMKLYFAQDKEQKFKVTVNNEQIIAVSCSNNGSATKPTDKPKSVKVKLKKGENKIVITGVDTAAAPNLDKIEIGVIPTEASAVVEGLIKEIPEKVTSSEKAKVQAVKAAYDASVALGGTEKVSGLDTLEAAIAAVDKEAEPIELEQAQKECQELLQKISEKGYVEADYTKESWDVFATALAAATEEYNKGDDASAVTLKELTDKLANAEEGLVAKVSDNEGEDGNDGSIQMITVTFDTQGGTEFAAQNKVVGEVADRPEKDPIRTGYTFLGWYLGDAEYDFSKALTQSIVLTAKWEVDNELLAAQSDFEAYEKAMNGLKAEEYTTESWTAMVTAYNAAKAEYDKGDNADVEVLRSLVEQLKSAQKEGLVKISDKNPVVPGNGSDGTTNGDGSNGNQNGTPNVEDPNTKTDDSVKVTGITIKGISHKIAAGKKIQLKAEVAPAAATNQEIKWTSSNKNFATVDENGRVTTKKAGKNKTVVIKAEAMDGSGEYATFSIKIMEKAVKKIKLKTAKSVKAGKSVTVKATVTPNSKKTNSKLAWSTNNKKYATVTSKGVVKTKKAGKGKKVRITAKATDGSGVKAVIKIKIN